MKFDECASQDVHTQGGGETPPSVGLIPNALPETQSMEHTEGSKTGVSTRNVQTTQIHKSHNQASKPHWYALRCTYGREKKAYDYMVAKGITAYHPTLNTIKIINGKRKTVTESRLPNIFFAYATEEELKTFVYDNVNLPFLRFYYRHIHNGCKIEKTPLIVPNNQMESLKIICASEAEDIIISPGGIPKFEKGQLVRIVRGEFAGVVGRVARHKGQQRVGIIVGGLLTALTTYVPSAYCEKI